MILVGKAMFYFLTKTTVILFVIFYFYVPVSLFPCSPMPLCPFVTMSICPYCVPCVSVSLYPHVSVSLSLCAPLPMCPYVSVFLCVCVPVSLDNRQFFTIFAMI